MHIQVSGKQIDIGEALAGHVETELSSAVSKYSVRPVDATVIFSRDAHEFTCECSAHLSTGLRAQANGRATDVYAAFDQAVEKLEKQLRRHKRRLKDHHQARQEPIDMLPASGFVLAAQNDDEGVSGASADTLQPTIIAETQLNIPTLTVGEAVMQMEMANQPILMFKNDAHGRFNVVYLRDDGNIGWIDPTGS